MRVTIRLFGRLRDLAGARALARELSDGATVRSAWDALVVEYPTLAPYAGSISTAVNAEFAKLTTTLAEGDEIAFMPPVSGGCQPRLFVRTAAVSAAGFDAALGEQAHSS